MVTKGIWGWSMEGRKERGTAQPLTRRVLFVGAAYAHHHHHHHHHRFCHRHNRPQVEWRGLLEGKGLLEAYQGLAESGVRDLSPVCMCIIMLFWGLLLVSVASVYFVDSQTSQCSPRTPHVLSRSSPQ
jgi:hypothetical protein